MKLRDIEVFINDRLLQEKALKKENKDLDTIIEQMDKANKKL
jgi:hypothetical protein